MRSWWYERETHGYRQSWEDHRIEAEDRINRRNEMTETPSEFVARCREYAEKATKPPWKPAYDRDDGWFIRQGSNKHGSGPIAGTQLNMEFCANSRTDLPAACDIIDQQQDAIAILSKEKETLLAENARLSARVKELEQPEKPANWRKPSAGVFHQDVGGCP